MTSSLTSLSDLIHVDRFAKLTGFAVIAVSGADRENFLQGQLTHDVAALPFTHHQLSGYCSPKGRLLAIMRQWKDEASVYHLLPQEIAQDTAKRLRMFVLRSKAIIAVSGSAPPQDLPLAVFGLYGACADTLKPNGVMRVAEGWLLRAPDCPVMGPRAWLIAQHEANEAALLPALSKSAAQVPQTAWMNSEIHAGLPWVGLATREAFVPQMVNLELVNGVSFTKGCYTGQEVVARSQYLGKLKRRMYRVELTTTQGLQAETLSGCDIWCAASSEPVGRVVYASIAHDAMGQPLDRISLLIECSLEGWAQQPLHLNTADGPALTARELPYAISEPQ